MLGTTSALMAWYDSRSPAGPSRRPSCRPRSCLPRWLRRSPSRTAPRASTPRRSYETASFATRSLSSTRTQANTAWAFAKNAEGSKQLFDSLATMTLVLGAKSGGDLTKAGFTPKELPVAVSESRRSRERPRTIVASMAPCRRRDDAATTPSTCPPHTGPIWRGPTPAPIMWMALY